MTDERTPLIQPTSVEHAVLPVNVRWHEPIRQTATSSVQWHGIAHLLFCWSKRRDDQAS
jgi:hypothetical protein